MDDFPGDDPLVSDCATNHATDGVGGGTGESSRRLVSSDRQSSLASSFTSYASDALDSGEWLPQAELEEIPSSRWLPPAFTLDPAPSCVDWQKLLLEILPFEGVQKVLGKDRSSERRCLCVLARGLKIQWQDDMSSWRYDKNVALLSMVRWLDISVEVSTSGLSPRTTYVCLLLFKRTLSAFGLGKKGETQTAWVSLNGFTVDKVMRLQSAKGRGSGDGVEEPRLREDGWWEVELGEVFVQDHSGVLGAGLREVKWAKGGLIVLGVEVRPKLSRRTELSWVSYSLVDAEV